MDSSSCIAPSGLPRPKSTTLLRCPPQLSQTTRLPPLQPAISRKPSVQLRSKPSSSRLAPPTTTARTRSGITTTGKTQIIPKGPVEMVKRLLPARSMLQLPVARRQASSNTLAGPHLMPLGEKRTVSSTSTRSIIGSQPVQGSTKPTPRLQSSRPRLRMTPSSSPYTQPFLRSTKTPARSSPPPSRHTSHQVIPPVPSSRLEATNPDFHSSSSSHSSNNTSSSTYNRPQPVPNTDIFSSTAIPPCSPIRVPPTRPARFNTPLQNAIGQTPVRRLPSSMIDTPLLPRLITRPFTTRDGMGMEMIKDAEMSFEDSSGEFSPVMVRAGMKSGDAEQNGTTGFVSDTTQSPDKWSNMSKALSAARADSEVWQREARELRLKEARQTCETLVREIEDQLDENEGIQQMIEAFRTAGMGINPPELDRVYM